MNVMVTFLLGLLIGGMVGMGLTAIFTAAKRADEAAEAVVLPHPCDGPLYKNWTILDWMGKVTEEFKEVREAAGEQIARDGMKIKVALSPHLWYELTDLITVCTSMLAATGCDFETRQAIQCQINTSNAERDEGRRVR